MKIWNIEVNPKNRFAKVCVITFLIFLGIMATFLTYTKLYNEINKIWFMTLIEYNLILSIIIFGIFIITFEIIYMEKIQQFIEESKSKIKSLLKFK